MKKYILLGASAIIAVMLLLFGRDFLDLYRLIRFVETSSAAYEVNGGPWPQLADVCIGCHGLDGNSQHPAYPSLAAQPAPYVVAQLQRFASGQRANPTMGPLAMTLDEAEVQRLAEYFARQPAKPNHAVESDRGLHEKGQSVVATAGCTACHGEHLMGRDQVPRLASQGRDYLLAQLDAFADGTRTDPTGAMKVIAATSSPDVRRAMATYLASLAPAQPIPSSDQQE